MFGLRLSFALVLCLSVQAMVKGFRQHIALLPYCHIAFIELRSMDIVNGSDQVDRAISTGKLHALPHFHTRPINVVVFHGSDREYSFSGGFPA